MKTFVIKCWLGGLGDHGRLTHLARCAKEAGYDEVRLSTQSHFRNRDTFEVLWKENPHVDGLTDDPGQDWEMTWGKFCAMTRASNADPAQTIEQCWGLPGPYASTGPEIYYRPEVQYHGQVVVDLGSLSVSYPEPVVMDYLQGLLSHYGVQPVLIKPRAALQSRPFANLERKFFGEKWLECATLRESIKVIRGAKAFIGLESGMAFVAAAIVNEQKAAGVEPLKAHVLISTAGREARRYTIEQHVDYTPVNVRVGPDVDPFEWAYAHRMSAISQNSERPFDFGPMDWEHERV